MRMKLVIIPVSLYDAGMPIINYTTKKIIGNKRMTRTESKFDLLVSCCSGQLFPNSPSSYPQKRSFSYRNYWRKVSRATERPRFSEPPANNREGFVNGPINIRSRLHHYS